MKIVSPSHSEWQAFLELARTERWRVPEVELALFRGPLADSAWVLQGEEGPLGFVTAVLHQKSGWVGNLIVPPRYRGRGYGSRLFAHALEILGQRGARSFWLTASSQGRPLYEKHGFRGMGGIIRWILPNPPGGRNCSCGGTLESLIREDEGLWGESRRGLLAQLAARGRVFAFGRTAALLQYGRDMQILGPWASDGHCPRENRQLLTAALETAMPGREVAMDVRESSPIGPMLEAAGFSPAGRCDLMSLGETTGFDLSRLVALASLGSMG